MKWRGRRRSTNMIDQRGRTARTGRRGGRGAGTGGSRRIRIPTGRNGKLSFGGILFMLAIFALSYYLNGNGLNDNGSGLNSAPPRQLSEAERSAQQDMRDFVAVVLADTEDVWNLLLPDAFGQEYREPKLVLFTDGVQSGCGFASSAVGPFYCPTGERVYLDLGFFDQLTRRLGAPGDFAQAYVIGHEIGHHVQTVLGISAQVRKAKARLGTSGGNKLSVRQELQADCFAGVWANRADAMSQILEPGDIEEALTAAAAIGDDTLQRNAGGRVMPDSFTHGTSAQRQRWFNTGYKTGYPQACDTFSASTL